MLKLIRAISFDKQYIKAEDDAHIRNVLLNRVAGATQGCDISHTANNITVHEGYFCVYGRWIKIEGSETIPIDEITTGLQYCLLVYTIDLTQANTDDAFNQGYFEIKKNASEYPQLTQEDLDDDGDIYQLPFAKFVQKVEGIDEFTKILKTIEPNQIWEQLQELTAVTKEEVKAQIDSLFDEIVLKSELNAEMVSYNNDVSGLAAGDVQAAIDNIATKMPIIQTGEVVMATEAGGRVSAEITFSFEFPGIPRVFTEAQSTVPGTGIAGTAVWGRSRTGCTIYLTRNTVSPTTTVQWIAVYIPV